MAGPSDSVERASDLGYLVRINHPPHTSWLSFGGIALEDCTLDLGSVDEDLRRGAAPVPTAALIAAKGQPLMTGDFFWAQVNQAAQSYTDVDATDIRFSPPPTPEQLEAFEKGA